MGVLALRPCHAVAYDMQIEMSSSAYWRLRLPAGKQVGYYTIKWGECKGKNFEDMSLQMSGFGDNIQAIEN